MLSPFQKTLFPVAVPKRVPMGNATSVKALPLVTNISTHYTLQYVPSKVVTTFVYFCIQLIGYNICQKSDMLFHYCLYNMCKFYAKNNRLLGYNIS